MAIAWVAKVAASSTLGAAVTTGSVDTSGANALFIVVGGYSGVNPIGSVTDNKGNTFTPLTARNAANWICNIFYCLSATVGSGHTFTVGAASTYCSICVAAFSGVATSSAFDQENGGANASGTTAATGSVTPSEDNELLIAGTMEKDSGDVSSVDSSFTLDSHQAVSAGNAQGAALAYQIQTTATARNATFTFTGATDAASAIGTFKQAAGGATTWGPLLGMYRNRLVQG